jgi:alkylhydroperoxidase family enzyme
MPVIPYQPADIQHPKDLIDSIRLRRDGELLNLDRMLLHSPAFAAAWNSFMGCVRNALSVPAILRELAICAVAVLNEAEYEFIQHAPEFIKAGGREQQLTALRKINSTDPDNSEFTTQELAVIKLTVEMTRTIKVSDLTMRQIKDIVDDHQQLVELISIIAAYNMVSRFLVTLGIEPE